MKTNLDGLYKTNSNFETTGIWMDVSEDIAFRVRRFGGKNSEKVKRALATYHKPYARQIEKGLMDPDKETELVTRAFVESCIVDWKGVEIDGEEKEFTVDLAVEFFKGLPDLLDELMAQAQVADNYKEDVGNS